MVTDGMLGLYLGVIILGTVHGILPDHGWPVASMYALNQTRTWLHGIVAGFILGFGHLVSSITVVVVYFWTISYLDITEIHWLNYVAGAVLILLGIREYMKGGHSHDHGGHDTHDHDHDHDHDHEHEHDHDDYDHGHERPGWLARIKMAIPFVGSDEAHAHTHTLEEQADERGLLGIAAFAFALGFAHNEEIEIIAICTGTEYCLELMLAYALAVLVAVMAMTLLLIAGFENFEDQVEEYRGYLPVITASVLIIMGFAFILGVF